MLPRPNIPVDAVASCNTGGTDKLKSELGRWGKNGMKEEVGYRKLSITNVWQYTIHYIHMYYQVYAFNHANLLNDLTHLTDLLCTS